MQAIIDEEGRVEIPRALREQLNLAAGALVDMEPAGNGISIMPVINGERPRPGTAALVHEGTLLVLGGVEPLTAEDVDRAIESSRAGRLTPDANDDVESS